MLYPLLITDLCSMCSLFKMYVIPISAYRKLAFLKPGPKMSSTSLPFLPCPPELLSPSYNSQDSLGFIQQKNQIEFAEMNRIMLLLSHKLASARCVQSLSVSSCYFSRRFSQFCPQVLLIVRKKNGYKSS